MLECLIQTTQKYLLWSQNEWAIFAHARKFQISRCMRQFSKITTPFASNAIGTRRVFVAIEGVSRWRRRTLISGVVGHEMPTLKIGRDQLLLFHSLIDATRGRLGPQERRRYEAKLLVCRLHSDQVGRKVEKSLFTFTKGLSKFLFREGTENQGHESLEKWISDGYTSWETVKMNDCFNLTLRFKKKCAFVASPTPFEVTAAKHVSRSCSTMAVVSLELGSFQMKSWRWLW